MSNQLRTWIWVGKREVTDAHFLRTKTNNISTLPGEQEGISLKPRVSGSGINANCSITKEMSCWCLLGLLWKMRELFAFQENVFGFKETNRRKLEYWLRGITDATKYIKQYRFRQWKSSKQKRKTEPQKLLKSSVTSLSVSSTCLGYISWKRYLPQHI